MKIALIRQRVTALGGAETTLSYLVRGMIAAGHEVTVYGTESAAEAQAALGPGVAYVRVPVWGGKTLRLLSFALNTRRLLKAAGPQVGFSLERVPGPAGLPRRGRLPPGVAGPPRSLSLLPGPARPAPQPLSPGDAPPGERGSSPTRDSVRVIANSRQVREEIIRSMGWTRTASG